MSQLFTATDVTATNGNKFIQVNTGDDVSLISPNSWIQIGNGRIQEVKTVNTSATPQTIELFDNWNGASGSGQSAISAPTAAEIKAAAEEIRQLRVTYEGIAGDVNVSAAANSIAKRDSNGRLKASAGVAADEVVVQSQLGSAATKDVGTSAGNVMEVTSSGIEVLDFNNMPTTFSSAWGQSGVANAPIQGSINWTALRVAGSNLNNGMEIFSGNGVNRFFMRSESGNVYSQFNELYHSGNSNFNTFGGDGGNWVADGYAENSTTIVFKLDWNGISTPTVLSILSGNFNIKNKTTGAQLVSNITSLTLNSKSSRKSAVVQYTTTGLTKGTHYRLDAGAPASFLLIS